MRNRRFFAIQYNTSDIWMNQFGDLGSRVLCRVFETADEAQTFLDGRKLRRGFRPCLAVRELSEADIRAMSNDAAACLTDSEKSGTLADVLMWRARFEFLSGLYFAMESAA